MIVSTSPITRARRGIIAGAALAVAVLGSLAHAAGDAKLPESLLKKGTLTVGSDAAYPPMELIDKDGKTIIGVDVDIGHALGKILGVKFKFENVTFDNIIPAIQSGKYDLGMSSFTDTKKREEVLDFVTYFSAGTSFYVKAKSGPAIKTLDDLCGKSVAIEKGTVQVDDVTAQNKKCTDGGKKAINVSVFPDQNGANLAIASGRAEVGIADTPVVAWIVKESKGQFVVTGEPYNSAPYGIAVPKNSGAAEPIRAAVDQLIKSGEYEKILKKWGITQGALKQSQINAGQ